MMQNPRGPGAVDKYRGHLDTTIPQLDIPNYRQIT